MPRIALTRKEKKQGLDLRDVLGPRERKARKQESTLVAKQWQKTAATMLVVDELLDEIDDAVSHVADGRQLVVELIEALEMRRDNFSSYYGKRRK